MCYGIFLNISNKIDLVRKSVTPVHICAYVSEKQSCIELIYSPNIDVNVSCLSKFNFINKVGRFQLAVE